jgi:hypothetical protein
MITSGASSLRGKTAIITRSTRGIERLTGALPDRSTHHFSMLTLNGDSCRRWPFRFWDRPTI